MRKFGLIGRTLSHSFSQKYFTQKFESEGIEACYDNLEIEDLSAFKLDQIQDYSGLNVTIPYKEEIISFLSELSSEAKEIGAVNTLLPTSFGWVGHNTDAYGFHQSIKPFLTNAHERALILGNGGASKAIIYVLRQLGIDIVTVARTPKEGEFRLEELNEHMVKACKMIVNCTPVGTHPNVEDSLDLPFEVMTGEHLVVDLIYNPSKTKFLQQSEHAGATILNGETMLKEQALKAWSIWNNE